MISINEISVITPSQKSAVQTVNVKMWQLFGEEMNGIIEELNKELVA